MAGFSGFRYWLGRRSKDDKSQINRWKKDCEKV